MLWLFVVWWRAELSLLLGCLLFVVGGMLVLLFDLVFLLQSGWFDCLGCLGCLSIV